MLVAGWRRRGGNSALTLQELTIYLWRRSSSASYAECRTTRFMAYSSPLRSLSLSSLDLLSLPQPSLLESRWGRRGGHSTSTIYLRGEGDALFWNCVGRYCALLSESSVRQVMERRGVGNHILWRWTCIRHACIVEIFIIKNKKI